MRENPAVLYTRAIDTVMKGAEGSIEVADDIIEVNSENWFHETTPKKSLLAATVPFTAVGCNPNMNRTIPDSLERLLKLSVS
jgi:hypothetical protein